MGATDGSEIFYTRKTEGRTIPFSPDGMRTLQAGLIARQMNAMFEGLDEEQEIRKNAGKIERTSSCIRVHFPGYRRDSHEKAYRFDSDPPNMVRFERAYPTTLKGIGFNISHNEGEYLKEGDDWVLQESVLGYGLPERFGKGSEEAKYFDAVLLESMKGTMPDGLLRERML